MSIYCHCRLTPISLPKQVYADYLLPSYKTRLKMDQAIYRDKIAPQDLPVRLGAFTPLDVKKRFPNLFDGAPVHLEVCCGSGDFLVQIAKEHQEVRFVGVDIALPCLQRAMQKAQELGLKNIFFYHGGGEDFLMRDYSFLQLQLVMVNFPDPWPKKRHSKRRVVQSSLLQGAFAVLVQGGCVFTATDVRALALDHVEKFEWEKSWVAVGRQPLENAPIGYYNYPSAYQKKNLAASAKIFYTQYRCKK